MSFHIDPDGWFPLSAAQHSRWFLYRLYPASRGTHNNVFSVALQGPVDPVAICVALDTLAGRHAMLRTRLRCSDSGLPEQGIVAASRVPLSVNDVAGQTDADLRQRVSADALRPFEPVHEPLVRAHLYMRTGHDAIFLLVLDHLICDGWSYWRLLEELGSLISAGPVEPMPQQGQPDGLPSYRAYVTWQREWLQTEEAARQLARWQRILDTDLPVLRLPFDHPRPRQSSGVQGVVTLKLGADLAGQLGELARKQAGTLFTTLLAAYQILLHRHAGQAEVVVGCPLPGRTRSEWDGVIGDFVNMVAMRSDFRDDPTVTQFLRRARNTALRAMADQDYPFSKLVEQLLATKGQDEHPFFQTMFVFQNARSGHALAELWSDDERASGSLRWGALELKPFSLQQHVGSDHIRLALQVIELHDSLRFDFNYDIDVFDAGTIERLAESFQILLMGMLEDQQQPVSQLPLLSASQREQVVVAFNATDADYPKDGLIHALFEEHARRDPEATALVFDGERTSYAELNRRANRIAHRLIAHGVKPDDRVAICLERGPAMVAGMLGILKAGGGYVPLDPTYPAERLTYMLDDCAPTALLTQSTLRPALVVGASASASASVPVLVLDDGSLASQPEHDPQVQALTSRHLAYVIYTSGSTGLPKGVVIEHANAGNLIAWALANFSREQLSNTLFATSINFDLSVYEVFVPLSAGATITVVRDVLAVDANRDVVSLINTVPSGIQALLQAGGVPAATRTVNLAGEPLRQTLVERIFAETAVQTVANLYGPSETTTYSTWVSMDRAQGFAAHIGRPIANTRIYLLDAHRQPVPPGVVGELYIGGAGVARGYLNRPELTAERFLEDPFTGEINARMYRTGDLGRWLSDGNIEYLGRNDFQVKIRGFRIELGEIEAKLSACAGVREAVVVAREDAAGDKRLVAYMLPHDGAELSAATLRDALSRELAEYMIPGAFVTLPSWPLTPNGKLDRKALPAPDQLAVVSREYEAPDGEIEQTIASIWQELLGLERVGRHDHFFELGGHSLMALQVISRIRLTMGAEVALRDLFDRPSVAALAERVADACARASVPIVLAERDKPLPLSWAQQRLWFLDQLDHAASTAYHMPAALHMHGALRPEALKSALDRIVARHESLRTTFESVAGLPLQSIAPASSGFHLVEHDLRHLDGGARFATIAELSAAEASAAFDLAAGPLIRGRLLQVAADEYILLLTQHHIISDGWSVGVLVRELSALYTAFDQGLPDPLPALQIQYADYAAWQRQWLQGETLQGHVDFWREHLSGAPALLELPTDRTRPPVQSYAGGSVRVVFPVDLTRDLEALSRRHGATIFMTLMAGWSALLSRLSGQDEIVVGAPVANRQHPQTEPLIGFFVNALAMRIRLEDDPDVAGLLAQVKSTMLDVHEHQDLPFEQVVDALQPARSLSYSPIFQTLLAWNNTPGTNVLTLPGLRLTPMATAQNTTRFDLSLSLSEVGDQISGELEYASDLFDPTTAERFRDCLLMLLQGMVADDRQCMSRLRLLSASQREQVVVAFNATDADYPKDGLIHALFEEHARRDPEATALVFDGERTSYAELNRRANRIAHRLIAHGVKPDDRVAICLERGPAMVAGMLGILKAGGGYVPLDPTYPAERLAYMLDDCAPTALLTQSTLRPALEPHAPVPVLVLDDGSLASQPEHDPEIHGLTSRHLAYVIYTSGSTGLPKGVMVEHRGVLSLVVNNRYAPITVADCVGHCSNPAFDASTWEVWSALLNGARLQVIDQSTVLDPEIFGRALVEGGVTALLLTTGLFNEYADALAPAFASLDHLLVGGDALDPRTASRALNHAQRPQHLINAYGPTEATTIATTFAVESVADMARSIPIGRPIGNARTYILDAHLQPVPPGVAGELYIGGAGVARGYLNRPELTAERFLEDPFTGEANARMYRTGDLGRWLSDGNIEYLGRNDFQVKIRGFRIELGEIEAKLSACAGVRESVVVAREDAAGDKRLVAYVLPRDGAELSAATLRDALSRELAEYMIPGAFVTLAAWPLTPNGKLDRKALPAPDQFAVVSREYEAPEGEIEQTMAQIWQDLLGLERVGRNDHFFELGGNSLVITRLGFATSERFAVSMSVAELYGRPLLKDMAAQVKSHLSRRLSNADGETTIVLEI